MEAELAKEVALYRAGKRRAEHDPGVMNRLLSTTRLTQLMHDGKIATQAAAVRLDNVLFTFMAGEIFAQFGNTLRQRLDYRKLLNVAVCFGATIGYVVPPECYSQGGYEPTATRLAPTAYDELLEEMTELLFTVAH